MKEMPAPVSAACCACLARCTWCDGTNPDVHLYFAETGHWPYLAHEECCLNNKCAEQGFTKTAPIRAFAPCNHQP